MLEIYLFTLIRSQLSNQIKYIKRGWNRKEGRGHNYFKKRGKLGQGVVVLKGGSWNRGLDKISIFRGNDFVSRGVAVFI